jgi:hypothetical protein
MSTTSSPIAGPVVDPLRFTVTDVTGLRHLEMEMIDGHRTAGDVAVSVASAMDLPTNVPWSLRDERNARMLDQSAALGAQVEAGAELVVIPKSHLG